VLGAGRAGQGRGGSARVFDEGARIVHDQQGSAGRATERDGAEPPGIGVGVRDPKASVGDGELRHDVFVVADPADDGGAERGEVEGDRIARTIHPQFRLHAAHGDSGAFAVSVQSPSTLPAGSANSATRSVPSG
jgi:hypothetical protein